MANALLTTLFLFLSLFLFSSPSAAVDFLTSSQNLTHGATLVSAKGSFELGFFSPGNSTNRYLGIWYKIIPVRSIVWVANRENPITNSSALVALEINTTTSDLLLFENNAVVWFGKSLKPVKTPKLHLLDNGNLVLKDAESEKISWQSFDYPTDTLLPGMKLGWDFENGIQRRLSAWKTSDDPSPGSLTMEMMNTSYPEPAMWNGSKEFMRTGPWNGLRFSAKPTQALPVLVYSYVNNKSELSFSYNVIDSSIRRMVLNQTVFRREYLFWSESEKIWKLFAAMPRDYCDTYGRCGAFSSCDIEPSCQCLKGSHPKLQEKWNSMDYTEGCVRNRVLNCSDKIRFAKLRGLKLPDTKQSWVNESMSSNECRDKCLRNCSCVAFANTDIRGSGSGCAIWFGDLVDIKVVQEGGQDLYVRMLASELERKKKSLVVVGVVVGAMVFVIAGLVLIGFYLMKRRRRNVEGVGKDLDGQEEDLELPLLNLTTISNATDKFSNSNNLGEGGFGVVFKVDLEMDKKLQSRDFQAIQNKGLMNLRMK